MSVEQVSKYESMSDKELVELCKGFYKLPDVPYQDMQNTFDQYMHNLFTVVDGGIPASETQRMTMIKMIIRNDELEATLQSLRNIVASEKIGEEYKKFSKSLLDQHAERGFITPKQIAAAIKSIEAFRRRDPAI